MPDGNRAINVVNSLNYTVYLKHFILPEKIKQHKIIRGMTTLYVSYKILIQYNYINNTKLCDIKSIQNFIFYHLAISKK